MLSDAKQVVFKLDIEGFSHDLQVLEFRVREVLNQPYEVKLELVSERPDFDLDFLLHRSAFLSFGPGNAGIHGQVYRIAQGDSGKYGTVQIPRVGMEVLVGFTDGDPDKPLILNCLPTASTPVPLDLPAEHTRSIFRSQSSPGGGGYNELRIEDKKGAEEISMRAQRDFVQLVLNDERIQVDNQRTVVIGGTASHDLRGEEHHLTHGNRLTELKQNDHLLVHGVQHIRVASQRLSATQQIHLSAGQQVVIDGGARLSVQAGGHWLTLGPEGIFNSVPILEGGAPAVGLLAEPLMPGALPLLKVTFDAVQQRHALISTRASRCLMCEAAKA